MAEFTRALRTLKALQAEQQAADADVLELPPSQPQAPARVAPNEPERLVAFVPSEPAGPGGALHEPAAPWLPNEPESTGMGNGPGACGPNLSRSSRPESAQRPRPGANSLQPPTTASS
jgi:hypothetical protein